MLNGSIYFRDTKYMFNQSPQMINNKTLKLKYLHIRNKNIKKFYIYLYLFIELYFSKYFIYAIL
jgi:hypothetical protein